MELSNHFVFGKSATPVTVGKCAGQSVQNHFRCSINPPKFFCNIYCMYVGVCMYIYYVIYVYDTYILTSKHTYTHT